MKIPIIPRAKWNAKHGQGSLDPGPEPRVVIHHSYKPALLPNATPDEEIKAVAAIEHYHAVNNGWAGIGYNFLVAPSGRVYEGRGWKYRGAHAGPVNGESIGICLLMDGNVTEPTKDSIDAVQDLIRLGIELGEVDEDYQISGHRDHMARSCPGDKVYARLEEFRHDYFEIPQIDIGLVDSIRKEKEPLPKIESLKKASARYVTSRYASDDEGILDFLVRVLEKLSNEAWVQERLGLYYPLVFWAVKKLKKLVQ